MVEKPTKRSAQVDPLVVESDREKKVHFFICPEMGDGDSWNLVSDPTILGDMVKCWAENAVLAGPSEHGEQGVIKVVALTDAEVEAMPEV